MAYETLLSPITIRGLTLRNRTVYPGMATKMLKDGTYVDQTLIDYHAARAAGGVGLNIVEAAAVHPPTAPAGFLSIADDDHIPGLKALTKAVHDAGGKISIQLWQGGLIPPTFDPSTYAVFPDPMYTGVETPVETIKEIEKCFGEAAKRAVECGFDSVEFHCGHMYSPHAFLSPGINKRTDEYGGTPENFMRYPLNIIREIRANIPDDMPLFMRVTSFDDCLPGGYDLDYMVEFVKKAKELGVDVADCSRGNFMTEAVDYEVPSINLERGFNVISADTIKHGADIPTVAVGRINDPDQMEEILSTGKADFVATGRAFIADPNFINKVAAGRICDLTRCVACNQGCYDAIMDPTKTHISCLQNPAVGREAEFAAALAKKAPNEDPVLVIGGGVGGMEAAELLKQRGFKPVLVEKRDSLGGQFYLAGVAPRKGEMSVATMDRAAQMVDHGIDVRLNTVVTEELLDEVKPVAAIIATGGVPIVLRMPGADGDNVFDVNDVLRGTIKPEGNVAIIGGGLVGLECAELLAERPEVTNLTVLEMKAECGEDLGTSRRNGVFNNLDEHDVKLRTRATCQEIKPGEVLFTNKKGEEKSVACDQVVMAVGTKPGDISDLKELLEKKGISYTVIGDALQAPRRAIDAIREGAEAALAI